MNKQFTIFDKDNVKDRAAVKGTDIILKETESGKILFRGSNKVIVSGSEFNALKDFNFDSLSETTTFLDSIPSYDAAFDAAGRPFTITGQTPTAYVPDGSVLSGLYSNGSSFSDDNAKLLYQYFTRRVYLFCVGIDGCGIEASRVFKVHNTKWIAPYGYADYNDGTGGNNTYSQIDNCLIPFKYRTSDADLSDTYKAMYFGRSVYNSAIAYYFKTFDADPELVRRYADDSTDLEQVTDVWADTRASEAEVVVKLKMSISNTDCREYFNKTTGTNDSKINTISLCTAVPYTNEDGLLDYADIRPFTRFNFPNEALIDTSKGIDITYYLYY